MEILAALAHLRESSKRAFTQSFDLAINLSGINPKKERFTKEVTLPHGSSKSAKVCVLSDTAKFEPCFGRTKLEALEKDKKAAKAFVRSYDWFLCEPGLMTTVGRVLGRYLGPTGRMPKLLSPDTSPAKFAEQLSRTVLLRTKDSPVLHCSVGSEAMPDSHVAENIHTVIAEIKSALPPKAKIKSVWLKLTMSQAVRID